MMLVFSISAVNDPPHIEDEIVEVLINTMRSIDILSNDIDPDTTQLILEPVTVLQPSHGNAFIDAGVLMYTPAKDFIGTDKIVVRICDSGSPLPALCATDTVTISVADPHSGQVSIPEGFSPNGDGANDEFVIGYLGPEKVHLEIYNRWGNLVYKNQDYQNDWRGTAMYGFVFGTEVPDGTYFYKVKVGKFEKARSFTIQR
jgi:gliding motility-associated-like protein